MKETALLAAVFELSTLWTVWGNEARGGGACCHVEVVGFSFIQLCRREELTTAEKNSPNSPRSLSLSKNRANAETKRSEIRFLPRWETKALIIKYSRRVILEEITTIMTRKCSRMLQWALQFQLIQLIREQHLYSVLLHGKTRWMRRTRPQVDSQNLSKPSIHMFK